MYYTASEPIYLEFGQHQGDLGPDIEDRDDQPDAGDMRRLGEEGGPVGLRVGRNPANLGDEVPAEGDLTLPETVPATGEM